MKKRAIIMFVTALIMALGMSQSVMAKEKKVKYLGHNYKGEVNDKKVPAGKGVMNVNGLMIEGDFSDHSVSNAEVWRTTVLGTSNTSFSGNITYDESEKIVLKAGGVISTKCYRRSRSNATVLLEKEPDYVKETLKEDRIVNSSTFETKELTLSYNINNYASRIFRNADALQLPTLSASYTVGLNHIASYGNNGDMDIFASINHYDGYERIKPIKVKNYKDSEGRIWEYTAEPRGSRKKPDEKLIVKYPNGSYLEYKYEDKDGSQPISSISWEIRYPNGKIVKTNSGLIDWPVYTVYNMGNYILKPTSCREGPINVIETFAKNVDEEKFVAPGCSDFSITSDSIDFSKLSNSETEKFFSENVIPYIEEGNTSTYTTPNGVYKKGVFTSNEQTAAANAKRAETRNANMNKSIANFKKKYGFDPSVDNARYVVKVGRNLIGVVDDRNEWLNEYHKDLDRYFQLGKISVSLDVDYGSRKCYKFYYDDYYQGFIWVKNNIITSVSWK